MLRQYRCPEASRVTASLLLAFLTVSSASDLALRHIFHHSIHAYPDLHRRLDVPPHASVWVEGSPTALRLPAPRLHVQDKTMVIERLADRSRDAIDGILTWGRTKGKPVQLTAADWKLDTVAGPDVTDKETVLSFARMAADAYILEPHTGEWEDVGNGFNYTQDFGWEDDGLRGHIFADDHNATVVIGLKGTSPAMFDGSETTANDKINDNLFFSCCCGQGGQFLWRQVCDCQTSAYTCNSTCLVTALREKNRYYYAAQDLYYNVTALYPNADVWMTGHSLGGSVASFLSLTFGHPAVTFEAVPDAMAAARLGLPVPPGHQVGTLQQRPFTGGFHFGHTADPVYMGTCNQASSVCTIAGYAMQSICHTGQKCVYDTVKDLGWRVGIGTHKINEVIRDVIERYDAPASCEPYVNCTDCYTWEYFESNGTETTTTTTTTTGANRPTRSLPSRSSRTRTETCKTPGWWGCLDEPSTTGDEGKTRTTSTELTSTCMTPGWFGCLDESTTTTTTATTTTTTTTTTTSPQISPAPTATTTWSAAPTSTSSCQYPGWFGGCLDGDEAGQEVVETASAWRARCRREGFLGWTCYDEWNGQAERWFGRERIGW